MPRHRHPSAIRTAACLALLSFGILAGSAQASSTRTITPGTGIAGIELKQTESAVRAAVGQPSSRTCARDEDRNGAGFTRCALTYAKLKLMVLLLGNRVVRVETSSSRLRTSSGVGPGTTRAALGRALPACKDPETSYCLLGRNDRVGARYTYFAIVRGKVGRTVVAITDSRDRCALGCG